MTMRGFPRWLVTAAAWFALPVALLLAPGCSEDENPVVEPADTTAPAATNLRIVNATPTSVTLAWQAPGDDVMEADASRYELRYSTTELTEANFADQGLLAPGLFTPDPPRSLQQLTIENLTPGLTYYFALRSADEVPNWSSLSAILGLALPENAGDPTLWGGSRLPGSGTTMTAFIYNVRLREDALPFADGVMEVMLADTTYPMTLMRTEGLNRHFEFSTRLAEGTYDYRFRFTRDTGEISYLPNPGIWSGPTVTAALPSAQEFVAVPVDTFRMGNPQANCAREERPAHQVILTHRFAMDRFEVTNAQVCEAFNRALEAHQISVVGDTLVRSGFPPKPLLVTAPAIEQTSFGIRYTSQTGFTPLPNREDWPATNVTWYGAAFYCNLRSQEDGLEPAYYQRPEGWLCDSTNRVYATLGWRMPTEAEWEYVARYNDDRIYPTGNEPPVPGVDANYGSGSDAPSPVGSYPAGASMLGILDLSGNVWEWCNDWLDYYTLTTDSQGMEIPQVDPIGPRGQMTYRTARGGSWGTQLIDLRCVRRFGFRPESHLGGVGFRCVRLLPE